MESSFSASSSMAYGGQIRISPKNIQKFKDRVREITRRKRGVSISRRLQELRRYFQGWMGYFSLVPFRSIFSKLDKWVRRRLRAVTGTMALPTNPDCEAATAGGSLGAKPFYMVLAAKAHGLCPEQRQCTSPSTEPTCGNKGW